MLRVFGSAVIGLRMDSPLPRWDDRFCGTSVSWMDFPVVYERKVRFSDSDAQAIVFNGNYLTYFDDAITDYLDALGVGWRDLNARGLDMVLGRVEIDFRSPGRFGDLLCTGARVAHVGNTSFTFELVTWEKGTDRVVVRGTEIQVMVDHETFEKIPVPDWFVDVIEAFEGRSIPRAGRPAN